MRLVVKIGTSTLVDQEGQLDPHWVRQLGAQAKALRQAGHAVVLVSSGAVGTGCGIIGTRPQSVADKQALAAIGQPVLMQAWQAALAPLAVAQVLLTRDDLERRRRRQQGRRTLERLLEWGVVPVINENDTVADEEIRVGDNDTLAAQVAVLLKADWLILLSDTDGIYDRHPDHPAARRMAVLERPDQLLVAGGSAGSWGTGGVMTKLAAARTCQAAGISTVVAHGRAPDVLLRLMAGESVGTRVPAAPPQATAQP